jgi:hypothetical protein
VRALEPFRHVEKAATARKPTVTCATYPAALAVNRRMPGVAAEYHARRAEPVVHGAGPMFGGTAGG